MERGLSIKKEKAKAIAARIPESESSSSSYSFSSDESSSSESNSQQLLKKQGVQKERISKPQNNPVQHLQKDKPQFLTPKQHQITHPHCPMPLTSGQLDYQHSFLGFYPEKHHGFNQHQPANLNHVTDDLEKLFAN